jgi:predicted DNA-binding transcriptional regulator AlpA
MTSKLADIVDHPERMGEIPTDAIPAFLIQLASVHTALAARLMNDPNVGNGQQLKLDPDTLLTAEQAAQLLSVTPHWLYRRWKQLPFSRRLSRKVLRFSENGIRKWQSLRKTY